MNLSLMPQLVCVETNKKDHWPTESDNETCFPYIPADFF